MVKKVNTIDAIYFSSLVKKLTKTQKLKIKTKIKIRLKQGKLATKIDLAVGKCAIKNEEKIGQLLTFNSSLFIGKIFFRDNGFHNIFVYQPTFSMLDLKHKIC